MYISPCPLIFLPSPLSPCPLLFLPSPLYINLFRDTLHHSRYITPCHLLPISIPSVNHSIILCISSFPLLPISIPTEIHSIILCISLPAPSSSFPLNPFHDSCHHSMYLFLPSHLYINPFHDSLHHSMYLFHPSPLYVNPFHDPLHHYMYISSSPLRSLPVPSSSFPLLPISIPSVIHSISLCILLPAPSSSFPLLSISIPSMIHSIILCISLPAPPLPSLSPLYQSLLRFTPSFYVYLSLPPPLPSLSSLYQSLRDSLHHSIYITPCPLLFLPSPLHINPFHDSLHYSMYISPCPLLFLPLLSISILSMIHSIVVPSPLYINPFHDSLPSFYVSLPSLSSLYQSLS